MLRTRIKKLEERVNDVIDDNETLVKNLTALEKQVRCGVNGHTMEYVGTTDKPSVWSMFGSILVYTFRCNCGYERQKHESRLTLTEKKALVALNVLDKSCLKKKGKK